MAARPCGHVARTPQFRRGRGSGLRKWRPEGKVWSFGFSGLSRRQLSAALSRSPAASRRRCSPYFCSARRSRRLDGPARRGPVGRGVPRPRRTRWCRYSSRRLRKQLPEGSLRTRAPGYVLDLDGHSLDLRRFDAFDSRSRRAALTRGGAEEAALHFQHALALWRGPAPRQFEERFAGFESARLEEQRLACLEDRLEADLALGRDAELVGELEALVHRHPYRERLRAQLMLALYRSGRHAEALASYQGFRRMLSEELGIDPSARLRELERRMLQQDVSSRSLGLTRPQRSRGETRPPRVSPRLRQGASAS